MGINKRVAIVTGVSRLEGIGRAICIELAKQNCDIFFTYWTAYDQSMPWGIEANEPDLIQQEILDLGVRCEKLELDLAMDKSISVLFESVINQIGSPSILINNATYSTQTNVQTLSADELDRHYAINIKAATLLTLEFVKRFSYSAGGRIVNITSGQSLGQMSDEIAYAITKAAIENLTYTISSEIASKGITINAVNPGPNDTGWMNLESKKELVDKFPMQRLGTPQDTAKLVSFLVSEDSEWVTGQVINSEGGFKRTL